MNWKTGLAIVGGILAIVGGELIKVTTWQELWLPSHVGGLLLQTAGLLSAVFGALYVPKPGGEDAQLANRLPFRQ